MIRAVYILGLLLLACLATSALPGGYESVDVDDEEVLTAADHAARELSSRWHGGNYTHRLAKVVKAKRQVVAGVNFKMDIIVGKTTCQKSADYDTECEFQDNVSTYKKCTVVVSRDLKNTHKLVSYGCILASKKDL